MPRRNPSSRLLLAVIVAVLAGAVPFRDLRAQQARLRVDGRASLAWWQVNPHLNHLWATTCPEDPSWRAGEGVSVAQARTVARRLHGRRGYAAIMDTVVPLYPRRTVRPVCREGVSGDIVVADLASLRGVRGHVAVRSDAPVTGLGMRDVFAGMVLEAGRYPEIRFRIDSLTAVEVGDTARAEALGELTLHGVARPMAVPVKAWHEAGGLRVVGSFMIPARDLVDVYGLSVWKIGVGVTSDIWRILHIGVDVVLREQTTSSH